MGRLQVFMRGLAHFDLPDVKGTFPGRLVASMVRTIVQGDGIKKRFT
jgi:hypothetical protein